MSFKVWLKSHAADKVLAPLRMELVDLIDQDATLFEVGCGTGDLIFQSAHKLACGYGIDLDCDMIEYAHSKKQDCGFEHISFECGNALAADPGEYDISTSTLCLHEMNPEEACRLLRMMVAHSKKVLIADYTEAKSITGKLSIEIDELFSGHYGNFRCYRRGGEIAAYAAQIGASVSDVVQSSIDGISIWIIDGNSSSR